MQRSDRRSFAGKAGVIVFGAALAVALLSSGLSTASPAEAEIRVLDGDAGQLLNGYDLYAYLLEQMRDQYDARRVALEASLASPEAAGKRAEAMRAAYLQLLGPLPDKTPLRAQVTGRIERDGYRIEKVVYESQPGHHVTANLYVPTGGEEPYPGVYLASGHWIAGKALDTHQAAGALFARHGMVLLAPDPICQGERLQLFDVHRHTSTTHMLLGLGAMAVGRSMVWYEAVDGVRAIDYLLSRPEVDRRTPVGMVGSSGGGTQTAFLMVLDDRIGPAASSCYLMQHERRFETIGPQDSCQNLPGEGAELLEQFDYLTMRFDRPTLALAGTRDYFDIHSTRAGFAETRRVFSTLGQPDHVALVEGDHGHGLHQPHREAAVRWMRRWLRGDDTPVKEGEAAILPAGELWATRSGQVLTEFVGEKSITEMNVERARALEKDRRRFWEQGTPAERVAEVARLIGLRHERGEVTTESRGLVPRPGYTVERLILKRPGELNVLALLFTPEGAGGRGPATLYVDGRGKAADAGPGGTVEKLVRSGHVVLSLDLRGYGEAARRDFYADKYLSDEHSTGMLALHIGRPLLGQRVEDVLAALDVLLAREDVDPQRVELVGLGRAGPVALHAAFGDDRFARVILRGSIRSWIEDVVMTPLAPNRLALVVPGALTRYDLPDLARALGDKLTLE
jgi:cephalosporin-C deacetylase-like acetyl esterase